MSQINLFNTEQDKRPARIVPNMPTDIRNGQIVYFPAFYSRTESDRFLQELRTQIEWAQEGMILYGRKIKFPRLTAWYGDTDRAYSFSGITLQPKGWLPVLSEIRKKLETTAAASF